MHTPPEAPRKPSARLPGLEALRAVAAICVLLLHVRATFGGQQVFGKGYLGVDFFLMLSGYLMARVQEPRLANGMDPWRFMVDRYRRLWPMMAMGGLLGLPRLFLRTADFGQFLLIATANFLLLPVTFAQSCFPLNIPAWTIFFELVTNFLHVHLFRHLKGWMLPLAILALLPGIYWIGLHRGNFDVGARPDFVWWGLVRCSFAYLIGIGLHRWWRDQPPIPVPAIPAILIMPLVLAGQWWLGFNGWLFDLAFVVLVCPLMIAGGLRLQRFGRVAGLLGQLSFPLFALQMPILQGSQMLGFGYWSGGAAALAVGIIGAYTSHTLKRCRSARKLEKAA